MLCEITLVVNLLLGERCLMSSIEFVVYVVLEFLLKPSGGIHIIAVKVLFGGVWFQGCYEMSCYRIDNISQ